MSAFVYVRACVHVCMLVCGTGDQRLVRFDVLICVYMFVRLSVFLNIFMRAS